MSLSDGPDSCHDRLVMDGNSVHKLPLLHGDVDSLSWVRLPSN